MKEVTLTAAGKKLMRDNGLAAVVVEEQKILLRSENRNRFSFLFPEMTPMQALFAQEYLDRDLTEDAKFALKVFDVCPGVEMYTVMGTTP